MWDKVLLKIRVSFDVLVSRKMVLSESSHHTYTHILCYCRSSLCPLKCRLEFSIVMEYIED